MTASKDIILCKSTGIPKADFASLYSKEDPNDPTSIHSCMGYVISLGGNPMVWQSKLQSEIALSTMAAEYKALSTAMRSLIHLQNVHHEVVKAFGLLWTLESALSTV